MFKKIHRVKSLKITKKIIDVRLEALYKLGLLFTYFDMRSNYYQDLMVDIISCLQQLKLSYDSLVTPCLIMISFTINIALFI